ncbi:hypothetical protein HOLleu_43753 [Holothuria leucospilota]|uniref:C2H2-type domain-containing protein n=1 Tax=Holothuria leucospilota TaxID=206669 RepID=A0A9Q1B8X9_HOLLE|nr:hypothetical protein HOLleu_43753 [Holothuria leucospilota]
MDREVDDKDPDAVLIFLQKYGVERLHETFVENGIDKTALQLLKDDDVRDLIPKIGDRVKFQAGWKKEHNHGINSKSSRKIICGQGGCTSIFYSTEGYKWHLNRYHIGNRERGVGQRDQEHERNMPVPMEAEAYQEAEDNEPVENDNEPVENDNEPVENDNEPVENNIDIARSSAVFTARLKASSIPSSLVGEIIVDVQELLENVVDHIQTQVTELINNQQPMLLGNDEEAEQDFHNIFSSAKQVPFSEMRTEYQQRKYFQQIGAFIEPDEKLLGYCLKSKICSKTGAPIQVQEKETFQYIPLEKSLKKFLEQPGVMSAIISVQPSEDPNVLTTYRDGTLFKNRYRQEGDVLILPLLLYNDDFETANPLGSRKGKHKISAFYTSVLCLPRKYQSRLENILLTALVTSALITKHGINSVVKVIKEEVQSLSNTCLNINGDGFNGLVRPVLFQVVGDNLGIHTMLGFVRGFTANYFCRFCRGHRTILQKQTVEDSSLLRTAANYAADLELNNPSETGVRESTILNDLAEFHAVDNISLDVMHDFLEGVIPLEMYLVVNELIQEEKFTLEELNSRISCFKYGFADQKNKPSPLKQSSLSNPGKSSGQTASQMMCLAFSLPLIIGNEIEEDCEIWELYLLLLDIFKIVMSPTLSLSATYALKALIRDHHQLFLNLFPERNLSPKQHFLIHYPRSLRCLGPLIQYSSMRFEGKHKVFKNVANFSCNFQNIAKTLAVKHQVTQCYSFLLKKPLDSQDVELNQEQVSTLSNVGSISDMVEIIAQKLGITLEQEITFAGAVKLHGYELREGTSVIISWNEDGPTFGSVQCIIVKKTDIYIVLKLLKTLHFQRHVQAFVVEDTNAQFQTRSDMLRQLPLDSGETSDLSSLPDAADDISTAGESSGSGDTTIVELDTDTSQESPSSSTFHLPPLKRQKRVHFDVKSILSLSSRGKKVMESIFSKKFCSKQDRHILVEVCTSYMVDHYGDKPSSFVKSALAAAVVNSFPFLKDPESPCGYEAWYCKGAAGRPATGYLEEHLRYVRRKNIAMMKESPGASASQPRSLVKLSKTPASGVLDLGNKDELVMMTEWLKCNMEPREKVLDFMRQTAFYRQQQIKDNSATVSNILKEFPRLLDRGMIEQDFALIWPDHEDSLYQKWDMFYSGIIEYGKQIENWQQFIGLDYINLENLTIDEKKALAFYLLPVIFRGKGKGNKGLCSVKEAITSFVDVQPEVADILQISKDVDAIKKPQPFVVCKGSPLAPTQTFVMIERKPIPQESLLKGIDYCFKAMYILDMAYQPSCCLVWQFIQNVIYGIKQPHVPSCIRDLRAFLALKH